jgi:hypothetical protein
MGAAVSARCADRRPRRRRTALLATAPVTMTMSAIPSHGTSTLDLDAE